MKAILVVDMPDTCEECPCCYGYICLHLGREMGLWALKMGKPVDCPLKPMPMKEDEIDDSGHDTDQAYVIGWNDCIDEIMGEKNETKSDLSTDEGWWRDYELYEMQND